MFTSCPIRRYPTTYLLTERQVFVLEFFSTPKHEGTDLPAAAYGLIGIPPPRGSPAAALIACDGLITARTVTGRKYHYVFCCHGLRRDCGHTAGAQAYRIVGRCNTPAPLACPFGTQKGSRRNAAIQLSKICEGVQSGIITLSRRYRCDISQTVSFPQF